LSASATLALVEEIGFAQAFSFKYSPRPGTPAAGLRRQIKDQVKNERLQRLQALLARQSLAFQEASVGRTVPVLLERAGRHPGQLVGRTPHLQAVHVEATGAAIGAVVDVRITSSHAHSLAGEPLAAVPPELLEQQPRNPAACA
jgi:tRNA-2-methylthio-N6-dimethylallyladenosine synthase